MALSYNTSLEIMKRCFPSWSDIRKRTNKSIGGNLLRSYANEFDHIQEAIVEYQKLFFMVNYLGNEGKIVDYLYFAFVGIHDNIEITSIQCEITDDSEIYYNNLGTMALYQNGYLLLHENLIGTTDSIVYKVDDNLYKVNISKQHIWNIFDEFATFAGLKRYTDRYETNRELANRIYQKFRAFPNPTDQGLKNAIIDAVFNYKTVTEDDIEIIPIGNNIDFSDENNKKIYEELTLYNQDIFRAKIWDRSTWDNSFQRTEFVPHVWDADMDITQDGTGHGESLRADFLKNIDASDNTDITVKTYKKAKKAITEYIRKNNIETDIKLEMRKYSSSISPKKITYKIKASDAKQIDPYSVYVHSQKKVNGEYEFYISDILKYTDGATAIQRNQLDPNTSYELVFRPKDIYASMNIEKCMLYSSNSSADIRTEYGAYIKKNGVITNKNILAHVTSISDTIRRNNISDTANGMTIGSAAEIGSIGIDITGMSNKMVSYKISAKEVNMTDNPAIVSYNGFTLAQDGKSLFDNTNETLSNITAEMYCNSYSFEIEANSDPSKQGSVIVYVSVNDGTPVKTTYTNPQIVAQEFNKLTKVKVFIQKNGANPVTIRNMRYSSYDIRLSLEHGNIIENKMYKLLPSYTGENKLFVEIETFTSNSPVIEYVYIGSSLSGARYVLNFDTNGLTSPHLEIDTDCTVQLWSISSSGEKTKISSDYITKPYYRNNASEDAYLIIDTSNFDKIYGSEPEILKKYKNETESYIILPPGEEVEKIKISGEINRNIESKTLAVLLGIQNSTDKEVYIGKDADFFVLKDTSNLSSISCKINKNELPDYADTFKVTGLPADSVTEFYRYDNGIKNSIYSNITSDDFDYINFVYSKGLEYIAYNETHMIDQVRKNIEIVNTFSPITSLTDLHIYQIEPALNSSDEIAFQKDNNTYESWSLGIPPLGITVTTSMDFKNADTYDLQIRYTNNKYILSNEIPLRESYLVDGLNRMLKEYVISAEDGIKINYSDENFEETFTTSDTGFDKLKCSNVDGVILRYGNSVIPQAAYSVLGPEGIIVWNNDGYKSKKIKAAYIVHVPESLTYTDLDMLYKKVMYHSDAYEFIEEFNFADQIDGNTIQLAFTEKPEKTVVSCSNPSFSAIIQKDVLKVVQTNESNKLAVHNGYIYDSGIEYFYFNDRFLDSVDRYSNVELHNITRQNGEYLFHIKSTNYLPYSNMYSRMLVKLCDIDMKKRAFQDISKFNYITACDSYNLWYTIDMNMSLTDGFNGLGIHFQSEDHGYAIANITDYIIKGNILSLYLTGDIKVALAKETVDDGMTFAKSVCIQEDGITYFETNNDFKYFIIEDEPEENVKYYLFVSGKQGTIDDLFSMPFTTFEDMEYSHKKNIDRFNLKFDEKFLPDYEYKLEFDRSGALFDDLFCDSVTDELSTSSTVEYGLTKLHTINLADCYTDDVVLSKDLFRITKNNGTVTTKPFYIKTKSAAYRVYVKVNDIDLDQYKDFNITVYGSSTKSGNYIKLKSEKNVNIIAIPNDIVKSYMYVEISGKKNKEIRSIEVYARYAQKGENALIPVKKETGSYISKIYDLGISANYKFCAPDFYTNDLDNTVLFYVRGCRENNKTYVFTDWKVYDPEAIDLQEIIFNDYKLFQFKAEISDKNTIVKINSWKLEVTE